MRLQLTLLSVCFLLEGCVSLSDQCVQGVVTDASMNTVTVQSQASDPMPFSTLNADQSALSGLMLGDYLKVCYAGCYEEGMEAKSVQTVLKADEYQKVRWFNEGIRLQAIKDSSQALYVLFSPDQSHASLFFSKQKKAQILERRTLPSGDFVWNQLDDDTLNLRQKDGVWTVSRRGALLYNQPNVDGDVSLGAWLSEQYEGVLPAADCPGIRYQLTLKHRAHSGDGYFLLLTTYLEAENGRDATFAYIGRRLTQRGSDQNPDATVWQLISDTDQSVWNFEVQSQGQTLQLLTKQFEEIPSNLSYELKKLK